MLKESVEDGVLVVTLSYGKTNSITRETMEKMALSLEKVNTDPAIKGMILTGEGRFFSSGFNLPTFISFKDLADAVDFFTFEENFLLNYFICKKPVICAMNGHAAAMGIILAMASDYRIVANNPKAKLGMSEIKLGLGLTVAEQEVVRFGLDSDRRYRDVLYFGEMYSPEQALAKGLVDEVVEPDQLLARSRAVIHAWMDNPNQAFITMKAGLKYDTAQRIREKLATLPWQDGLNCFFDPAVRATLEFVQTAMEG